MPHYPNPNHPGEKIHPPKPVENPQWEHAEDCSYFSFGLLSSQKSWRKTCGECTCSGYPQVECGFCGAIIDEEIEAPSGPDDKRDDAERIITIHTCD